MSVAKFSLHDDTVRVTGFGFASCWIASPRQSARGERLFRRDYSHLQEVGTDLWLVVLLEDEVGFKKGKRIYASKEPGIWYRCDSINWRNVELKRDKSNNLIKAGSVQAIVCDEVVKQFTTTSVSLK